MEKQKSRQLSFIEFFKNLQREYIIAELRYKIYPKAKDKDYYKNREMAGKKATIENISIRNNLKSIFSDDNLYRQYHNEMINEWGLPNFLYRDAADRERRRHQDIINYFYKGSVVSVLNADGSIDRGIIVITDINKQIVVVTIDDKNISYPFNKVTREL